MSSQTSEHRPRWAKVLLISLVTLSLLWLVIIRGYADYLAGLDPQRAAALNPIQPDAAAHLASAALDAGELDRAGELAQRIAQVQPLEGRALRVLGAVAEREGDADLALRYMRAAVHASPRDTATQYWLALHALNQQDLSQALRRLDRVLRFQPEALNDLFPLLGTIAANRFGSRQLVPYLTSGHRWTDAFLNRFAREAQPIDVVLDLERLLTVADRPLHAVQSARLTSRLLYEQDWERLARRISERSGISPQSVRDPDFRGSPSEALLAWNVGKLKGADLVFNATDDGGVPGIHLYFHNRRVEFQGPHQLLMLDPGHYRLLGQVRLDKLETPRGLQWALTCIGKKPLPLAESALFKGNTEWRPFEFELEVPATDCAAQWLTLRVAARIAAERQMDGEAWFTDLRIEPLSAESTSGEPEQG